MGLTLFFIMVLFWLSLAIYQDDAASGCLKILLVPFIAILMFLISFVVWIASTGKQTIYFKIERL